MLVVGMSGGNPGNSDPSLRSTFGAAAVYKAMCDSRRDDPTRSHDLGCDATRQPLADRRHRRAVPVHRRPPPDALHAADEGACVCGRRDHVADSACKARRQLRHRSGLRRTGHVRRSHPTDSVTVVESPYYYDRKDVHLDRIVFESEPNAAAARGQVPGDSPRIHRVASRRLEIRCNSFPRRSVDVGAEFRQRTTRPSARWTSHTPPNR